MPVVKQDGSISDFKLTINKAVAPDLCPLPKVEVLFSTLSGGQTFFRLEFSQAYVQLKINENSKKYTIINTPKGLFQYNSIPFGISTHCFKGLKEF